MSEKFAFPLNHYAKHECIQLDVNVKICEITVYRTNDTTRNRGIFNFHCQYTKIGAKATLSWQEYVRAKSEYFDNEHTCLGFFCNTICIRFMLGLPRNLLKGEFETRRANHNFTREGEFILKKLESLIYFE